MASGVQTVGEKTRDILEKKGGNTFAAKKPANTRQKEGREKKEIDTIGQS